MEPAANLWTLLVATGLIDAGSAFALGYATVAGLAAGLIAQAVGTRRPLRPALHALMAITLLAPPLAAPPAWPALLAAAMLLCLAPARRPVAANDNREPLRHPFALAA